MNTIGMRDWISQRLSAIFLLSFTLFLVYFLVTHQPITFEIWSALFAQSWVKFITLSAVLSLIIHAWIGIWTVLTDYLKNPIIRLCLQTLSLFCLSAYGLWAIAILWSQNGHF